MMGSRHAGLAIACLLVAAGCGAKSSLPAPGDGASEGASGRRGPERDRERSTGAGGDELREDPPCELETAGDPFVAGDFAEGNAVAPFVVATRSGADGAAQIVLQGISQDANFWHPELRLSRWRVGDDFPADTTLEQGFTLAGVDAHAWGRIGFTPGSRVGLAWFRGDEAAGLPTGLKFRPIEPESWAFGEEVFVDERGETAYAIVPHDGHPDTDWAITYRGALDDFSIETRLAIVTAAGELASPPVVLAGAREYPGIPADVVATDAGWLAAISFGACVAGDPVCDDDALVIATVQPGGAGQIAAGARFAVETPGHAPRRASLARDRDIVWAAWSESLPDDDLAPRRIILAGLDEDGEVVVAPRTLADGAVLAMGVQVSAGPDGPVVVWGEPGDPAAAPDQIGAGAYVVHHERASAPPQTTRFATTAFAYGPGSPAAELADPRSVLVTWAANIPGQLRSGVWLARLDCR
jgi:hypothetical protein